MHPWLGKNVEESAGPRKEVSPETKQFVEAVEKAMTASHQVGDRELTKGEAIHIATNAWQLWAEVYTLAGDAENAQRCQQEVNSPPETVETVRVGMTYTHRAIAETTLFNTRGGLAGHCPR